MAVCKILGLQTKRGEVYFSGQPWLPKLCFYSHRFSGSLARSTLLVHYDTVINITHVHLLNKSVEWRMPLRIIISLSLSLLCPSMHTVLRERTSFPQMKSSLQSTPVFSELLLLCSLQGHLLPLQQFINQLTGLPFLISPPFLFPHHQYLYLLEGQHLHHLAPLVEEQDQQVWHCYTIVKSNMHLYNSCAG